MCWTSNTSPIKRVAREGIEVYKIVCDFDGIRVQSLVMGFIYEYYKLYTKYNAIIPFVFHSEISNQWIINEGFHSYGTYLKAKKIFDKYHADSSICKDLRIVKCLIPQGATFYKNEKDEIVSSHILLYHTVDDKKETLHPQKSDYSRKNRFLHLLLCFIRGIVIGIVTGFVLFQLLKLI